MKLESALVVAALALSAAGAAAARTVPSSPPEAPAQPKPIVTDVVAAARSNDAYRHVLFTGTKTQLVLMTIPPGGDIGVEAHPNVEQLIFIVEGRGKAVLESTESPLAPGDVVVVPPGTKHDVVNSGSEPLRIYTVYAPPNHIDGRVQQTKADAEADTADKAFGDAVR